MNVNDSKVVTPRGIATSNTPKLKVVARPSVQDRSNSSTKQKYQTDNEMNGLLKRLEYQRYLRLSNICLIMLAFKTLLCYTYYQFDHIESNKPQILLVGAYSLHCIQVLMRLVIQRTRLKRMPIIEKLDYCYKWEIFKILISFPLYPIPWLHLKTFDTNYSQHSGNLQVYPFKINYLLIIFSIFHAGIVGVKSLILNTIYYSPRAQRIGRIYQIHHHGLLYAVKCIVKDHPIRTFTLITCLMWILSTFAMKIVQGDVPVSGNKFIYYQNCFWFIGTSLATIGYGDMYPTSDLGYIFVCLCCIWSTFNNSVITFLLVSNLSLKHNEHKSLQLMKNVDSTLNKKKLCGEYIKMAVWRLWLNKKYQLEIRQSINQKKLKAQLHALRIARKRSVNISDLTQQMQNQFDNALISIEYLHQNNKSVLDFIAKNFFISTKILRSKSDTSQNSQQNINSENLLHIQSLNSIKNSKKQQQVHNLPPTTKQNLPKVHKTSIGGVVLHQKISAFYQQNLHNIKKKDIVEQSDSGSSNPGLL